MKNYCNMSRYYRIYNHPWLQRLLSLVVYWYILLVFYTSRIRYLGHRPTVNLLKHHRNVIFCSWHARLLLMPLFFRCDPELRKQPNLFYLSSPHQDGIWMSTITKKFGCQAILGTSIKREKRKSGHAISALKTILREIRAGKNFYITPDAIIRKNIDKAFQIRGALLEIAQLTGRPIVPISFTSSRQRILHTRDHFVLPLPFGRLNIICGKPVYVAKHLKEEQLNDMRSSLERTLNRLSRRLDNFYGESVPEETGQK